MPDAPTNPTSQTAPNATSPDDRRADSVWHDENLAELHQRDDKAEKVQAMFSAIARSYDLNNRVHSLWQDELWRRTAVKMARVQPGDTVLDLACGTGDLTQAFAKKSEAQTIIGSDFTPAMLELAEHKRQSLPEHAASKVRYQQADAMDLPFESASADVISIAFGLRNVQEPDRALAEFWRVLKPGGRVIILEFHRPGIAPVRWFNDFYCGKVMPRTATWISRDKSGAYRYLPRSVASFMTHQELAAKLAALGFADPRQKSLSLGIAVCTAATKPA